MKTVLGVLKSLVTGAWYIFWEMWGDVGDVHHHLLARLTGNHEKYRVKKNECTAWNIIGVGSMRWLSFSIRGIMLLFPGIGKITAPSPPAARRV